MFVVNSRLGSLLCDASCSICSDFTTAATLILKLWYILPSSLTRVLPRTLGSLPHTCVGLRTGGRPPNFEAFLDSVGSAASVPFPNLHITPQTHKTRIFIPSYTLVRNNQSPARASCITPSLKQSLPVLEYLPVVHLYAPCPQLGPDLPWDESLPRNPHAGGMDSHPFFSTHTNILFSEVTFATERLCLTERSCTT